MPMAMEHRHREPREHAAAEGDEHVVDEQLPREAYEVHAAGAVEPLAAQVGDADDQPQRDREVQRTQQLGVAQLLMRSAGEREGIDDGGGGEEGDGQPDPAARRHPSLPEEIPREERQHEETGVAQVEGRVETQGDAEEHGCLDGEGRGHGQGKHDERFGTGDRRRRGIAVGRDDELLPQPIRVLPRELAREGIQAAHAFDRDQERLVLRQARPGEGTHLVAQMRLQLLDVGPGDGAPPAQVGAPLADLRFERRLVGGGAHAWQALIQIRFSVWSTIRHRFRSASSCARPSLVMR
jgi:hypothetical protein